MLEYSEGSSHFPDTLSTIRAKRHACELDLAREASAGSCMAIIHSLLKEENDLRCVLYQAELKRG